MNQRGSETLLSGIVTNWSQVNDPIRFVARYAPAIRNYLLAIIRDDHEAEDAAQEFLMKMGERGFADLKMKPGSRFRDYLITAVRNSAYSHLKKLERRQRKEETYHDEGEIVAADDVGGGEADAQWIAEWRACALNRALGGLARKERGMPGSVVHRVLKLRMEHPEAKDAELAEVLSKQVGRTISPEAYRKQLSRSRRALAELLVLEVAETLSAVTPEEVEEELIAVGLMEFVEPFLPSDWRERGCLIPEEDEE